MTGQTPPPRRRRIAGEQALPTAKPAGKPVVKKPAGRRRPADTASEARTKRSGQPGPAPVEPRKAPVLPRATGPANDAPARPVVRTAVRSPRSEGDRSMRPIIAGAVAGVLLVGGLVTSVLGFQHWQGESFADARESAAKSAGEALETILSYRYDELEEHRDAVREVMTGEYFADEYVKTTAPALEELAPQRKVQVRAEVRHVAPVPCGESCSTDEVQLLAFVDLDRRIEDEQEATVFGNRLRVEMRRVDGDWKVADVTGL